MQLEDIEAHILSALRHCTDAVAISHLQAAILGLQTIMARRVETAAAVEYGCHVDLEEGQHPDGCVIDTGRYEDCIYAGRHERKEQCEYWQPIKIERRIPANQPAAAPADERAAFEAWVSEKTSLPATCDVHGFYVNTTVYDWWKVWQARAANETGVDVAKPKQSIHERRKVFEAWAIAEGFDVRRGIHRDNYAGAITESVWEAWQAGASSINGATMDGTMTEAEIRKTMTPEQIQLERKLTCEAIDGAMAFGYQNTNPPPSADHWLAPFWKIGRKQYAAEFALLYIDDQLTEYLEGMPTDETSRNLRNIARNALPEATRSPAMTVEAVAIPSGWNLSVHESDDRVWLGINSPGGAGCALSAAASIDEGRGSTIAAQVLRALSLDLAAHQPAQADALELTDEQREAIAYAAELIDEKWGEPMKVAQVLRELLKGANHE